MKSMRKVKFHLFLLVALFLTIRPLSAAESFILLDRKIARALTALSTHTKPTIVALWSSECTHCKKNLALFAHMAKNDQRLMLITVAAEPFSPGLATLLDKYGVPGSRYAYGDDAPEAIAFALAPKWRGELPHTLFFDGRGSHVAISGVVDEAQALRYLGLALSH